MCLQIVGLSKLRSFPNRGSFHIFPVVFGTYGLEYSNANEILLLNTTNSWKSIRAALSGMLRTEGLATYIPLLNASSRQAVKYLLDQEGTEMDIHKALGRMTLRNILLASFGIEMDSLATETSAGPDDAQAKKQANLLEAVKVIFHTPMFEFLSTTLVSLLPTQI